MQSVKEARSLKTYLPIVHKTKDGGLEGHVLDIYPEERSHAVADYGPWPSKRVLGEYPTFELTFERLMQRMHRFARAKRAGRMRRHRKKADFRN